MPTYSIKAPNGKTYQIDGPAGASDAQVRQQVLAQFPDAAGGSQPRAKTMTADEIVKMGMGAAQTATKQFTPALRPARAKPSNAVRKAARVAGYSEGAFGIPEHISAAIGYVIPNKYHPTGNPIGDRGEPYDPAKDTYAARLKTVRAVNDYRQAQAPGDALAGNVIGSLNTGLGASRAIAKTGAALASKSVPVINALGKALVASQTLTKGQTAKNVAKLVAGGATGGALQAAGSGEDVKRGAIYGAIAGPASVGIAKVTGFLARPVIDLMHLSSAKNVLRRFTDSTSDDIAKAADDYRAATGAEPTVYELLPLKDRLKIAKAVVGSSAAASERTAQLVTRRAANVGSEMASKAKKVVRPETDRIISLMQQDLAAARTGARPAVPTGAETQAATRAAQSPADLELLRGQEASAIMAPHDNRIIFSGVDELIPQSPQLQANGQVRMMAIDPEVASVIRTVAGSLRLRDPAAGITGREVSDMLTDLRSIASNGGIEGRRAQAAINHIESTIAQRDPQMFADVQRMTAAYADRSRMLEGMTEGARGRTRESVPVTNRGQGQMTANAYDTPEGASGRALGQVNSLTRDLAGRPNEAVNTVGDLAENTQFQKALGANIGAAEADALTAAAQAQGRGIHNLSSVAKESKASDLEGLSLPDVARSLMALSPSSLPGTKFWAMSRLMEFTHLPEGKALAIVERLFSQDPKMVQQGLNLLNSKASNGRRFLIELQASLQGGRLGAAAGQALSVPGAPRAPEDPASETPVEDIAPDEAMPEGGESPYAADLEQIYSAESPEFLDLIDRQFRQESGHRQFGSDGQPLTSSAGAIGVAQVMPGTAPIAAEMAGLPYDEQAYRTDPAYNKMLGMAYMSNMLQRYDGNVALALAAYNAGPGRVDKALSQGDNWFAHLPAETQNYVQAIL